MNNFEIESFVTKVGARIKHLRKERGLTQLDLAGQCDMDETAIQRLETGRSSPTVKTLFKITRGLKVEMWEFFREGFDK